MKQTEITTDLLLEKGWKETNDILFPFEKDLTSIDLEYTEELDEEEERMKLVVHRTNGNPYFGILLPEGGILNLNINYYEDLEKIEFLINSYNPVF